MSRVFVPLGGDPVDPDNLTTALRRYLPADISYDVVFESVRYLSGRCLDPTISRRVAWRLAGNLPQLKSGQPVAKWAMQRVDEWVPVQILDAVTCRDRKNKVAYQMTFLILAGTPCPMRITGVWGPRAARAIAIQLGFSRPWGKYPYRSPYDLVGLRLLGLLEAARSRESPEFHEIYCGAGMQNWNRKNVLKLRLRNDERCPNSFTYACRQCAYGYDACRAATHPHTYVTAACNKCGQGAVLTDPTDPARLCLKCAEAVRLQPREPH